MKSNVRVKSNIIEQGAEPIYLHLVRPIVKPYTRTLDSTLELLLMIGDFVFALATYPLHLALQWWHKRFGVQFEPLETEQDTQGGSSDVDTSEVPTSFLASSGRRAELDVEPPEGATIQLAPGVMSQVDQRQLPNSARSHNSGPRIPNTTHNQNSEANSSANTKKEARRQRTLPLQKDLKVVACDNSSPVNSSNIEATSSQVRRRAGEASSRHQIWHPQGSPYVDVEDQADLTLRPSDSSVPSKDVRDSEEAIIAREQQQLDEWRQYPPFPSAYPPTPLAVTSRLAAATVLRSSTIYPPIQEERSQQDFRQSLLPPREPLNPSPAGDLSDQSFTFGNSPCHLAYQTTTTDEADDSMSADDEDEDEFNTTLRTPLPPLGSLRSQPLPRRLVPLVSGSSAVSMPSRLSTLTTADDESSLRTRTSSESLSASKSIPVSVIGKKRSYPRTKPTNIKNRVRQIEDKDPDNEIADPKPSVIMPSGSRRRPNDATENPDTSDTADDPESSLKSSADELDKEQIPPEKRRKVTRSSSRALTGLRPNITRHTPPPQIQKSKAPEVSFATKRSSSRMKSRSHTHLVEGTEHSSNTSSSASISDLPSVPLKSNTRPMRRK